MAKNQEIEFSTTAGSNTDIGGLGIDEGMPPSRVNDAMRYLMKTRADGITRAVTKAAGSYTAVKTDHNQFWRCTGAVTLNLTAAATLTDGWCLYVRANGGIVTIDPAGTELIDGTTTYVMADTQTAMIICTGTEFFLIDGGSVGPSLPVGSVMDYAGSTAPTGWLLCYGQAVSRTTYAALFASLSTIHGVGDGSTTFNLPDLRGRVVAGKDDMGGSAANVMTVTTTGTTTISSASVTAIPSTASLAIGMKVSGTGITAGTTIATIVSATAITLSANATASGTGVTLRFGMVDAATLGAVGGFQTQTLVTAELPSHTHTQQGTFGSGGHSADHTHVQSVSSMGGAFTNMTQRTSAADGTQASAHSTDTVSANHSHSTTISGATTASGSGSAHNNTQPTIILNKIIKY